jgi:hypothetical protein
MWSVKIDWHVISDSLSKVHQKLNCDVEKIAVGKKASRLSEITELGG